MVLAHLLIFISFLSLGVWDPKLTNLKFRDQPQRCSAICQGGR